MSVSTVLRQLAVALALALAADAAQAAPKAATEPARVLRRRAITFDDASLSSLPVVHVAPGLATVLAFESPIRDGGAILSKAGDLFYAPTQTDRTVVIVPQQSVKNPVNLNVTMADGTVVSFALVSAPKEREVDVQVDVKIAIRSAADSVASLKAEVEALSAKLKECQSTGASRIAELILSQNLDGPQAFDTHPLRGSDKQNRLRMHAHRVYRLFSQTYVVLSVENRDPNRNWVLAKPVVRLSGGGQEIELKVAAWQTDLPELPPGDTIQRVVIAFETPQNVDPRQRLAVALLEKDGTRRVELRDLEL